MCRHSARSLPPDSRSPAAARQFLRTELAATLDAGPASADITEDAALIVSELVTNAVNAGSTIVQVDLTVHRSHLVITVGDDAAGQPRLETTGPLDQRHRGLHLVDALARRWTVHDHPDGGKDVTAELALPPDLTGQLACDPSYL